MKRESGSDEVKTHIEIEEQNDVGKKSENAKETKTVVGRGGRN